MRRRRRDRVIRRRKRGKEKEGRVLLEGEEKNELREGEGGEGRLL